MTMLRFLAVWAMLFGTYLLLVDQLVGPELLAGAVSSLLVACYDARLRGATERRYRLPPRPRLRLFALGWDILRESLLLLAAAFRPAVPVGSTRTIAFHSATGASHDQDVGRRALVVARLCASPNGFVVLRQREPGLLLMHDLLPPRASGAADPVWPG